MSDAAVGNDAAMKESLHLIVVQPVGWRLLKKGRPSDYWLIGLESVGDLDA